MEITMFLNFIIIFYFVLYSISNAAEVDLNKTVEQFTIRGISLNSKIESFRDKYNGDFEVGISNGMYASNKVRTLSGATDATGKCAIDYIETKGIEKDCESLTFNYVKENDGYILFSANMVKKFHKPVSLDLFKKNIESLFGKFDFQISPSKGVLDVNRSIWPNGRDIGGSFSSFLFVWSKEFISPKISNSFSPYEMNSFLHDAESSVDKFNNPIIKVRALMESKFDNIFYDGDIIVGITIDMIDPIRSNHVINFENHLMREKKIEIENQKEIYFKKEMNIK